MSRNGAAGLRGWDADFWVQGGSFDARQIKKIVFFVAGFAICHGLVVVLFGEHDMASAEMARGRERGAKYFGDCRMKSCFTCKPATPRMRLPDQRCSCAL